MMYCIRHEAKVEEPLEWWDGSTIKRFCSHMKPINCLWLQMTPMAGNGNHKHIYSTVVRANEGMRDVRISWEQCRICGEDKWHQTNTVVKVDSSGLSKALQEATWIMGLGKNKTILKAGDTMHIEWDMRISDA